MAADAPRCCCAAGQITEDRLREVMTTMGDRWTDDMVDELFHCSPITGGQFQYVDFVRAIKHGTRRDTDDEQQSKATAETKTDSGKGGGSGGGSGGGGVSTGGTGSGGGSSGKTKSKAKSSTPASSAAPNSELVVQV